MPSGMSLGQMVVIGGKMYVGGGAYTEGGEYKVLEYTLQTGAKKSSNLQSPTLVWP